MNIRPGTQCHMASVAILSPHLHLLFYQVSEMIRQPQTSSLLAKSTPDRVQGIIELPEGGQHPASASRRHTCAELELQSVSSVHPFSCPVRVRGLLGGAKKKGSPQASEPCFPWTRFRSEEIDVVISRPPLGVILESGFFFAATTHCAPTRSARVGVNHHKIKDQEALSLWLTASRELPRREQPPLASEQNTDQDYGFRHLLEETSPTVGPDPTPRLSSTQTERLSHTPPFRPTFPSSGIRLLPHASRQYRKPVGPLPKGFLGPWAMAVVDS